jgi:hypothetical protein
MFPLEGQDFFGSKKVVQGFLFNIHCFLTEIFVDFLSSLQNLDLDPLSAIPDLKHYLLAVYQVGTFQLKTGEKHL